MPPLTAPLVSQLSPTSLSFRRSSAPRDLVVQNAVANHRPFIHPLLSPNGDGEVTENQPGHHLWQHGLYVGLNDVNGIGYWEEGLGKNAPHDGTFHPEPLTAAQILGRTASWKVVTEWRDPQGRPLLRETQAWQLTDEGKSYHLDVIWTLTAVRDLRFGASKYGGLFLRMPYRPATGAVVFASTGATAREEIEQRCAKWVALAMPIPGRENPSYCGIALLDHPTNAVHPTPWRLDSAYGLSPSRCIAGAWSLGAGDASSARYRVFVFSGKPDRTSVDESWRQFAST